MRFAFFSLRHDPYGASRLHIDLMNSLIERGHEVFYALPFWLVDAPFWLPCLAEKVDAMRVPRMGGFDAVFYSHADGYAAGYPLTPLVKRCDALRRFFILRTFLPGHIAIADDPEIEKIATSLWLYEQAEFYAGTAAAECAARGASTTCSSSGRAGDSGVPASCSLSAVWPGDSPTDFGDAGSPPLPAPPVHHCGIGEPAAPANRIHKVFGGVNLARFHAPANDIRHGDADAGGPPRVLFRHTRDSLDGTRLVMAALHEVQARGVEFVAEPFARDEPDILRQYSQSHVFVSGEPPWGSGWSSSVAEAMACGCSVVCGDVPAVRHLAEEGVTARVVPPGNVEALADAIEDLLTDAILRRLLVHAAAQRVAQYSTERMAEQILEIVERDGR